MANLDETTTGYNWEREGVYQIEKNDPVEGGADGISNRQAKQLAVRTRDLHTRLSTLKTEAADLAAELTQLTAEVDVKVGEAKTYTEQQVQGAKSYTDDREVLIRKDLESGDADTLTSAKGYTDAREELIRTALGSGDATTLTGAEAYADGLISDLVDSAPAGLNTLKKLASAIGNNATFSSWVTTQLSGKQPTIKNVNIPNFNSFDPSTLGLAVGEFCNFNHYSTSSTTGRPSMGTGSNEARNNPLSGIYGWSGTVTRIYGTYYLITAVGQCTSTGGPQVATRVYNNGSFYEWVLSSEYSYQSTNGYFKLPSGIMIAWGYNTSTSANRSITFPVAFRNVYSIVTSVKCDSDSLHVGAAQIVSTTTTTVEAVSFYNKVEFRCYAITNGGSGSGGTRPMYWIAIGTWK